MAFRHTIDVLAALEARLKSLRLGPEAGDEPLFQRVSAFGANQLAAASRSVFAAEQRVCFLVPGGDQHATARERNTLTSTRTTRVALLIADRDLSSSTAALTGGPQALGILELKDRVIDDLTKTALGADFAFEPTEGEPLVITDADKPSANIGRECWMQWLVCHAGSIRQVIP